MMEYIKKIPKYKRKLLFIFLILTMFLSTTSAHSTWYQENFNAQESSIHSNILPLVFDSYDLPQTCFIVQKTLFLQNITYKYPLTYAFHNTEKWMVYTADERIDYGPYISMTLDSKNIPHVAVYLKDTGDLKYMTVDPESGKWVGFTLDENGDVGLYCSIAVDSKDQPHISYYLNTNPFGLKYATYDKGQNKWNVDLIDEGMGAGTYTSISINNLDQPGITYFDFFHNDKSIRYAYFSNQRWNFESIDYHGNVGYGSSLCYDSNNIPHVSYQDSTNSSIKYAYQIDRKDWHIETVYNESSTSRPTSLVLDTNDRPHVAFTAFNTQDEIKYAYKRDESWNIQTVASGLNPSIALNNSNIPGVLYFGDLGITYSSPTLMITKPVPETTFQKNNYCQINWIGNLSKQRTLQIDLYQNDSFYSTIAMDIENDGKYSFFIPDDIPNDTFTIRLSDTQNETIYATSTIHIIPEETTSSSIYIILAIIIVVAAIIILMNFISKKRR